MKSQQGYTNAQQMYRRIGKTAYKHAPNTSMQYVFKSKLYDL